MIKSNIKTSGFTLAIVVIEGNRLYGANVGDSRVYLQRDNSLAQLSTDHAM